MERKWIVINGVKYLLWDGAYWLPIEEITHACGQKLTKYKKFRKIGGGMKEINQGNAVCFKCQIKY